MFNNFDLDTRLWFDDQGSRTGSISVSDSIPWMLPLFSSIEPISSNDVLYNTSPHFLSTAFALKDGTPAILSEIDPSTAMWPGNNDARGFDAAQNLHEMSYEYFASNNPRPTLSTEGKPTSKADNTVLSGGECHHSIRNDETNVE